MGFQIRPLPTSLLLKGAGTTYPLEIMTKDNIESSVHGIVLCLVEDFKLFYSLKPCFIIIYSLSLL